jgi:hypothetical protein
VRVNQASIDERRNVLCVFWSHSQFLVTSVTKYDFVDSRGVSHAVKSVCERPVYLMVQPGAANA